MYLKEIRMENFKTFRKKVTVPIYKGFTGITGPNGSGKSNIADAVLFVLGPRSSRMVRARKLSDLIFHGNDRYPPAKQCQVSLVFDNEDRTIPRDSDEVILKRVIRKSRSDPDSTLSYFYVNGKPSSQGQFENILTHAHLSAEGYNIVLQGHINEFIGKTPTKIREEIDEIAGIRKYDDEIKSAMNKKEKTEENLERIRWHLDFIKGRLRDLKKEKEAAEKYRDAQREINSAKKTLYTVQRDAIDGELKGYHEAIKNAENKKIELRGEIEKLEVKRESLEKEIQGVQTKIDEITGEEGRKLKSKLDTARLELMRAKDVIETAQDTIMELKKERGIREEEIADIEKKKRSLHKEIEESLKGIEKVEKELEKTRVSIEEQEGEMERSDMDLLNIRRDLGKVSKKLDSKKDQLSEKVLERDRTRHRLENIETSMTDTRQMITTLEYEIKDLKENIKEMKREDPVERLKKIQKEYMGSRAEEKRLVTKVKELEKEITSLNRQYTSMKVEMETSEKLKKGMSYAVDDIISARDRGEIKGIFGTIGELGDVPEKYSTAMEVAAGGRINAIVVEDDEVAAKCIKRLKSKKAGRATFLPLNKVTYRRPGAKSLMIRDDQNVVGLAMDLIKFDPRYKAAFSWVFGDTVVVDNIEALRRLMGGVRLVTLDGEIAGAGGDITGGSRSKRTKGIGFGKRARGELEKVAEKLQEKTAESSKATEMLNEVRDRVNELEMEIRQITSDQRDGEELKERSEKNLGKSKEQLDIRLEDEGKLKGEMESEEKKLRELESLIEELGNEIEKLGERRDRLNQDLEKATPSRIRDTLKKLRDRVHELTEERSRYVESRDSARAQLEMFSKRETELEDRLKSVEKGISKAQEETKKAAQREESFSREVEALEKVLSTIDEKTKGLYEKLTDLNRKVEKSLAQRESRRQDLMIQDQVIITQRSNIRTAEDKMADVLSELQQYGSVEIDDPPYPSERDLQRKVRDLESILSDVGSVNLKALEEYEEMEEKKSEITSDLKALEKEKKELVNLIDEIHEKRTTEFIYAYREIDENFQGIYNRISGGGKAYFELENEDDPLNGGLIIRVKPPGKKMTSLGSLSGGEKSLTSMAFIFSVQAWDPSPCYLLDEVDQNLDAVNAEIVANMVRENSQYAQFILISLRKISLKEAHHLYGVTLQNGNSIVLGRVDIQDVDEFKKGDTKSPAVTETAAGGGA